MSRGNGDDNNLSGNPFFDLQGTGVSYETQPDEGRYSPQPPIADYDEVPVTGPSVESQISAGLGGVNPFSSPADGSEQLIAEEKAFRRKILRRGAAGLAVIVVAVAAIGIFTYGDSDKPANTDSGAVRTSTANPGAEPAPVKITEETPGEIISGGGNADQSTGAGAIFSFDYQYYSNADGNEAFKLFAPGVPYKADELVATIKKDVGPNLRHHLEVIPTQKENIYYVILKLSTDGDEEYEYVFSQKFITEKGEDGKFYIRDYSTFDVAN